MGGDASEATAAFARAKDLFNAGQYNESMRLLAELDRRFPNTRNILLAMASCLEKMNCFGEAEQICDRLLAISPDARAAEIKARVIAARGVPETGALYAPIDLDEPPRPSVARPAEAAAAEPGGRRRMILIGVVVAVAILVLAIPLVLGRNRQAAAPVAQQAQTATAVPAPAAGTAALPGTPPGTVSGASRLGIWLVSMLVSYVLSVLAFYPMLRFTGRLRNGSFAENFQDLAVTMFVAYLWGLIPLLGGILGALHIMRHYEISCLEMIVMIVVACVLEYIILLFVLVPLMLGLMIMAGAPAIAM